ncbi:hypothetical protein [Bacillus thuringiensis]|uniref:hypothetical protein n=1 Tax=Bacillus thuringiensis TaxID=1428 RepID=UPI0021D69CCB|nr:hypothetical protein [Bacillus thuringiensis]MCU7667646.1 hypothetical protein [Bacillus thuringiensis]
MSKEKQTHESFGMLQFSRTSHGGDTQLFGSSIPHRETIRMRIAPGAVERSLNHDYYYAENKSYIEVEMSHAQFSEAITSMNMGSGVPVTIRRLNGEQIDSIEMKNKRIQFEEEFENTMENIMEQLESLVSDSEDILRNKKSLTKSDRETILKQLFSIKREIGSNMPFVLSQFNESMDKVVHEAKMDMEASAASRLMQLGFTKLDELNQLSSNPNLQLDKK